MRLHRFIGDYDIGQKTVRVEDASFYNQIVNVLRLSEGDELILVSAGIGEARCRIVRYGDESVECEVIEKMESAHESDRKVSLYCSVLKRENFEFVVQKATEAGVARIVPILAARTVKLNINADRIIKIAKEAAEQSGRITIPEIESEKSLTVALQEVKQRGTAAFFDGSGARLRVSSFKSANNIAIFIGPEGGWEKNELSAAAEAGASILKLGALTLRAETAAIVTTYLLCQQNCD